MDWSLPYPSRRQPVVARRVVATSQPVAAQAGIAMLERGGSAVDAAIAAAATLTVVEPTGNGIGSDAFAVVHDGEGLHGLNASGRSPRAWARERFVARGGIPAQGWDAVTVPGAVSAWVALHQRFGRLPFADLLAPAIRHADEGYAVSPVIAAAWQRIEGRRDALTPAFHATFLPQGRAPRAGELVRLPDHAATLATIAGSGGEAFYRGSLAEAMVADCAAHGGALALADLAEHRCEWCEPLGLDVGSGTLHELPPNGQGLCALLALGILAETPHADEPPDSPRAIHFQVEAMKRALSDAHRAIADPRHLTESPDALLDPSRLREIAAAIDPERAAAPGPALPADFDTVYLCVADGEQAVSFIQSNFQGFGSGVVVPGTGIALQNRARGFVMDPASPNVVAGGKRPFHTIIPGMLTRAGDPLAAFGHMGGAMQPQGHLAFAVRTLLWGQNPQAAIDAPRWFLRNDGELCLEAGWSDAVVDGLIARGHPLRRREPSARYGGAQAAWRLPPGCWAAATDPRKDGSAVGC